MLAVGLLLFALAARLLFPAPAEYVRRQLLGGEALGEAVRAFYAAVSGPGSLGDAIAVFREALYARD